MKTKWFEDYGAMVEYSDLHLAISNRIDFLNKEIEYLLSVNKPSDGMIFPTENEYANGMIRAYQKEIEFLTSL